MSIRLSPAVESLVKALGKLPGYGPRSAQRAAFHLLQNRDESLDELAAAVEAAGEKFHALSVTAA